MRHIFLLILSLLLCGCAASQPIICTECSAPTVPEIEEPSAPEPVSTQPPDPMQMLLDAMTVVE